MVFHDFSIICKDKMEYSGIGKVITYFQLFLHSYSCYQYKLSDHFYNKFFIFNFQIIR